MTKLLTCLLAGLGTSVPPVAAPAHARAEPAEAQAHPAEARADPIAELLVVRFDVEGGQLEEAMLHTELVAALREADVVAKLPGNAPLEVLVSMDGGAVGAYAVTYQHRGALLDSWSCPCTGDELRARMGRATIDSWVALARDAAALAPPPAPTAPVSAAVTRLAPVRYRRGFASWVAGIATTAIGTSIVTGASALLISDAAAGRKVEPVAIGVWSGGIAMVATGAVLWGIGRRRLRSATASIRAARLRRSVVFVIEGRF